MFSSSGVHLKQFLICRYLLAAISLAVLVPSLLQLETLKPTNADDRGLLTMMMAAGSLDVVICIALFGVFLGLAFASDTPLVLSIFRGPIEILLGIAYGVVLGMLLWILPGSDTVSITVLPLSLGYLKYFLLT